MKNKNFTKLDRRHTGFGEWKYFIDRPPIYDQGKFITAFETKQIFFMWRSWCWETWGPSKELEEWLDALRNPMLIPFCQNQNWCWQNNSHNTRIYLRDDKELSHFLLKWCQ